MSLPTVNAIDTPSVEGERQPRNPYARIVVMPTLTRSKKINVGELPVMCHPNQVHPDADCEFSVIQSGSKMMQKAALTEAWIRAVLACQKGDTKALDGPMWTPKGTLHRADSIVSTIFSVFPPTVGRVVVGEYGDKPCLDVLACGVQAGKWSGTGDPLVVAKTRFP